MRLLPEQTQRLLRAGETIDHVAAVVRELLDNALDAGADRITVHYWPERWQIEVSDNGVGLSPEDLRQCALRHTTSKLYEPADLYGITTLGFRGEALFALACVSDLEIASRPAGEWGGWRVSYDPVGHAQGLEPVGLALGTVVTVRDLFGRLPVRQGFLNLKTELAQVIQVCKRCALAHPGLTLQLLLNDRTRFHWLGVTQPLRRMAQLLNVEEGDLRQVQSELFQVVLGLPDRVSRPRPDHIFIGINGRIIDDPDLLSVVTQSFQRTLPKGRHPVALVLGQLPPGGVDWHRHPSKQTVHLGERPALEAALKAAIHQALGGLAPRPQPDLFRVAEARATYQTGLRPLKALSQVQNTYILAEHPEGLWLVEQHVCHERVLFEQLSQPWAVVEVSPVILPLSPLQIEHLEQLGLTLESFGEKQWCVRMAPACIAEHSHLRSVLWELSLQPDLEQARVTVACRSAIKNGTPQDLPWLQHLLDQWQVTQNPHTCPHGRPIYLTLSNGELGHFFRRRWRICDGLSDSLI